MSRDSADAALRPAAALNGCVQVAALRLLNRACLRSLETFPA